MEDLTLTQGFAIISLNSMDSQDMTTAKRMALRCISAAAVLELYLDGFFTESGDKLILNRNVLDRAELLLYQEEVLKHIFKKRSSLEGTLAWWLLNASRLSDRNLKKVEHIVADSLKANHYLEEIPNLLGCDLLYTSAEITMREFKSSNSEYIRQTEGIRSELLEEGELTQESISMLWLLRESSCLNEIFTKKELENVLIRVNELYRSNPLAKSLFEICIHHMTETAVKNFLFLKKRLMKTPTGTGLNFDFPFIERSESVFIDTEAWFSNKEKRLEDVLKRLKDYGHETAILRAGVVPLLKIDNVLYEAVPDAVMGKIPIQGMRLRRYQM
jgi:hypothetical protein